MKTHLILNEGHPLALALRDRVPKEPNNPDYNGHPCHPDTPAQNDLYIL